MVSDEIRVLLVDDNPDDVSIIRRLLTQYERIQFVVLSTNSTGNCLTLLEAGEADLLFLDYSLPGEDGLAFLRRAAGVMNLPPVIIITGQGDYRLVAEAIRSGASDCIHKHAMTPQTLGHAAQQALAKFRHEEELSRFDQNIIRALVRTSEEVDPTAGSPRLADLAESLGRGLNLSDYQIDTLRHGALLHDVGKLGVRTEVITKPGPLTDDEYEEVRLHPLIGERMCAPLHLPRELGQIIRHHHERWDGNGYVDGLSKVEIPLLARIVSVVDAFDAMTTSRPYRDAMPLEEALGRLGEGAGSQWDPEVVEVFLGLAGEEMRAA
jgi:putative two-component system response regulator